MLVSYSRGTKCEVGLHFRHKLLAASSQCVQDRSLEQIVCRGLFGLYGVGSLGTACADRRELTVANNVLHVPDMIDFVRPLSDRHGEIISKRQQSICCEDEV